MSKKYFWLKLKDDFFRDKRIKKLRKIAGGDTYTVIYLKLQILSLKNNGVLIYEGIEETLAEELALDIDEDVDNVKITLAFLQQNGLIEEAEENHFVMVETLKCIGSESASAERVRKHRELKAEKQKVLQCNTQVTIGNIEIEKEIEQEIELEEDKDKEKKKNAKRFLKPTIQEIQSYCDERNNGIDAQHFFDYYESNGWYVGKNKMKDWKAAVRNWERRKVPQRNASTVNNSNEFSDIAKKIREKNSNEQIGVFEFEEIENLDF